jgi:hypothetical protein
MTTLYWSLWNPANPEKREFSLSSALAHNLVVVDLLEAFLNDSPYQEVWRGYYEDALSSLVEALLVVSLFDVYLEQRLNLVADFHFLIDEVQEVQEVACLF